MDRVLAALASNLEPFRHFAPEAWFSFSGLFPSAVGAAVAVAGAGAALWGGRMPAFRPVAAVLGLICGVFLTPEAVRAAAGLHQLTPKAIGVGLPAALAILGGAAPLALVFVSTGMIGSALGAAFVADADMLVGAVPGFILGGVMGLFTRRYVMALCAATLGGVLFCGGALAACRGNVVGHLIASGTWTPSAVAALVAVFGMSFQVVTHTDDEERLRTKGKALEARQREKEDRARDERFAQYSRRGKSS